MSDQPLGEDHYRAERAEAEVERLREAYKSAERTIRLGEKQVAAWKRGEKWCPRCEGTGATGAGEVCCAALAGEEKSGPARSALVGEVLAFRAEVAGLGREPEKDALAGEVKPGCPPDHGTHCRCWEVKP